MTLGDALQLLGGLFEAGGLVIVGMEISETRARFTDRPGILARVRRSIVRLLQRLRLVSPKRALGRTISVSGTGSVSAVGSARVTVSGGTIEQRVTHIEQMIERQQSLMDRVDTDLRAETEARETAIGELRDELTGARSNFATSSPRRLLVASRWRRSA